MQWTELIRVVLELVLGGGFIATLYTLRQTKRKLEEEVRQLQTTNTDSILRTNEEYIVKPLKREINGLRITVRNLNRALQKVLYCAHVNSCPVRSELYKLEEGDSGQDKDRQHGNCQRDNP